VSHRVNVRARETTQTTIAATNISWHTNSDDGLQFIELSCSYVNKIHSYTAPPDQERWRILQSSHSHYSRPISVYRGANSHKIFSWRKFHLKLYRQFQIKSSGIFIDLPNNKYVKQLKSNYLLPC